MAPIAGGWPAGHGAGRHGGLVALVPWAASRGGARAPTLERPWRRTWDHLPKRSAGLDFTRADYAAARTCAREVARATLGEALWAQLQHQGYLDVPSTLQPGLTYRLRVGRRIEIRCASGVRSPWPSPYLCINPTYPLPEEEFFAHLYLVRDREDLVRRCRPPAVGSALGRTF